MDNYDLLGWAVPCPLCYQREVALGGTGEMAEILGSGEVCETCGFSFGNMDEAEAVALSESMTGEGGRVVSNTIAVYPLLLRLQSALVDDDFTAAMDAANQLQARFSAIPDDSDIVHHRLEGVVVDDVDMQEGRMSISFDPNTTLVSAQGSRESRLVEYMTGEAGKITILSIPGR